MVKILFFFTFLFCLSLYGQNSGILESILRMERTQIVQLDKEESNSLTYLPSEFAEDVLSAEKYAYLKEATIIKVYYVYTQYKLSASFDQLTLDRKRFRLLNEYFPEIIENPIIEWQILEQTGCKHFNEGANYFHGFVIVHRPILSAEEEELNRLKELEQLSTFFDNPTETFVVPILDPIDKKINQEKPDSPTVQTVPDQEAYYPDGENALYLYFKNDMVNCEEVALTRKDLWVDFSFEVDTGGSIRNIQYNEKYSDNVKDQVANTVMQMPEWKPATKNGEAVKSTVNLEVRVSYSRDVKGMYTRDGYKPVFTEEKVETPTEIKPLPPPEREVNLMVNTEEITIKSTGVFKGLELINGSEKIALVMDVTGSMAKHIVAMTSWISNHNNSGLPFTSYTFFNDGDNKSTKKKKIGQTGGIYMTEVASELKATIKKAVEKGGGGERPENDIEAVLHSIENDDEADVILLIGDNYSEVRDLELLEKVDMPVHVLLCSAPKAVRPDYLQIAKETGGKFLINGEMILLGDIVKGEKLFLQGVEYKYTDPEFKIISE